MSGLRLISTFTPAPRSWWSAAWLALARFAARRAGAHVLPIVRGTLRPRVLHGGGGQ